MPMGLAKARRVAVRVHRGQSFGGAGLFVAHLERVVRTVGELGGGSSARQAAWLYAVREIGVGSSELYRLGVRATVVRVVEALGQCDGEGPPAFTGRLLRVRDAALVRYAILTDFHRHFAGRHQYEWWREQHGRLGARVCNG